jgi:ABC-2 type transport system permease protein
VADLDRSPWSRAFLRNLDATREVRIVARTNSADEAQALLRQDRTDAALVIPHGLQASLLKGSPGGLAVYLKGAYIVRVSYLGSAISGAVRGSLAEVAAPIRGLAPGLEPGVRVVERPLYNVVNGYGGYAVPGVATVILQATLLFGVAMFMGLRRERDTWRMTPAAFLGVWAAFTLLGSLNCLFWFGFVFWLQDYPRAGNIPGMLLGAPVFAAAVSAMALLVGSLFERRERSMQVLAGTSIPFFFLSGLAWPTIAMAPWVVALARLIPSSTAVLMFVKLNGMGARIADVAPDLAVLAFLAIVYGAAAMLRVARA